MVTTAESRRDRGMRLKRTRIFDAARALFEDRAFDAVTTQAVADRADVAAGTVFRYAATKSELLLMVYNEEFRLARIEGERAARTAGAGAESVFALLVPILRRARVHPANSAAYQRELLFGAPEEEYRAAGLAEVALLERSIAAVLTVPPLTASAEQARLAASAAFAALHLAIARMSTGAHPGRDAEEDLREQVQIVVHGIRPAGGTHDHAGDTRQREE